jgi:hypothetical protein
MEAKDREAPVNRIMLAAINIRGQPMQLFRVRESIQRHYEVHVQVGGVNL